MSAEGAAADGNLTGHLVEVEGAVKRFGSTTALTGVDFAVQPGRFLVLLGPSGSGKSTLIRSLAGIERLYEGRIRLGGQLVSDGRRHLPPERRDLAMVFQDYALWPHLTVEGNVGYALRRRKLPAPEARRRAMAALDRVGLARHAAKYPHELSGGEQQRVALARAVVAEPRLLLFDEPLSNLDADLRERLRVEIATLTRESGATAVYITHDQAEAFALADEIGVLDQGRLVQLAAPEEIYRRPASAFVARFTGSAGELPGTVVSLDGEFARARVGEAVLRARPIDPVAVGDSVQVLVRPAATRIVRQTDAPADPAAARDDSLSGFVIDVAYRGRGYDHVVACAEGTLTAVYDPEGHPRGSAVRVLLDSQHCLLHPTTPTGRDAQAENSCGKYDLTAVRSSDTKENAAPAFEPTRSGQ